MEYNYVRLRIDIQVMWVKNTYFIYVRNGKKYVFGKRINLRKNLMLCGMHLRTEAFREECEILRRHAYKRAHTHVFWVQENSKHRNVGW